MCILLSYFAAEQELIKLQRQYRILEGDRKSYSDESQNKIRKQRAAIEALQEENEELMKENKLAGSQLNQTKVLFLYYSTQLVEQTIIIFLIQGHHGLVG